MIIEEMCITGACNRGVCYIGCLKKFEELDILRLKKVIGISIGSFILVCHILGYSSDEMLESIINKNVKDFRDISLNEQGSILKGENYKNWIHDMIAKKIDPNITLLDFYKKFGVHFISMTTCIHTTTDEFEEGIIYLSHELTPTMPLIVAVNASMAFPFIFPPVSYNGAKFIDGGLLDNMPSEFLKDDSVKLRVNFKPIDSYTSTNNPITYIGKIYEIIVKRIVQLKGNNNHHNTITICCDDFDIIDFDMNLDDKITLFKRGYICAEKFLSNVMTEDSTKIT